MADEPNKMRAEIRARQAEDGKKAMAEYEAGAAATRAKTEKLRALRLAKEAADEAAPKPPAKTKAKSKAKPGAPSDAKPGAKSGAKPGAKSSKTKKSATDGKLAEWLEDQSNSGRGT